MDPVVADQLRMKRERGHVGLADRDRMAAELGQYLHRAAELLDPGRPDEHRTDRRVDYARELDLVFEAGQLSAERVPPGGYVDQAEMLPVGHDHSGAGSEDRAAGGVQVPDPVGQPGRLDALADRGRLATRDDQAVEATEVGRQADLDPGRADRIQVAQMRGEPALYGENTMRM